MNNEKEENIYKDYSGRTPGTLLNVLKIKELVDKIISWQYESSDGEDERRKK
jgi:hypothetical protein